MDTATITIFTGPPHLLDAQDFAAMLCRMYKCWTLRREGTFSQTRPNGEKYVLEISCPGAQSMLATESGIHRLVRTSPFDPQGRRHTTFAEVHVEGTPPFHEQRRSYVLHPYTKVTDHVSGATTDDAHAVFDGHLGAFISEPS